MNQAEKDKVAEAIDDLMCELKYILDNLEDDDIKVVHEELSQQTGTVETILGLVPEPTYEVS